MARGTPGRSSSQCKWPTFIIQLISSFYCVLNTVQAVYTQDHVIQYTDTDLKYCMTICHRLILDTASIYVSGISYYSFTQSLDACMLIINR